MITKISTTTQLKQMFLEILLNKTDKINDISEESVLNAIAYGVGKVGQKCLVNQSIVEGHLFPDTAYGSYLDNIAKLKGVSSRFGETQSTTYIRIIAEPGTTYLRGVNQFVSLQGYTFSLENDVVIGKNGFSYAKVKCVQFGEKTNVDALTINRVIPIPIGHVACTNEYRADGGRDQEPDDLFRLRIKESANSLSRGTLSYLEQIFMKINNNVLKIHRGGMGADGKLNLIVVSVNGQDFTQLEFNEILSRSEQFLNLTELLSASNGYALNLINPNWFMVDIDFRVEIDPAYNQDKVRREIQIQIQKLFDYRYWKDGDKVEWDDMLFAAKNIDGVRYIPDSHFKPNHDINIYNNQLPRIRGFILRDLDGNITEDNNAVLSSFYYPNDIDEMFQTSVLSSI